MDIFKFFILKKHPIAYKSTPPISPMVYKSTPLLCRNPSKGTELRIRDFMLNIKQSSPIARNYIFCLNVGSLYFKATPNVV